MSPFGNCPFCQVDDGLVFKFHSLQLWYRIHTYSCSHDWKCLPSSLLLTCSDIGPYCTRTLKELTFDLKALGSLPRQKHASFYFLKLLILLLLLGSLWIQLTYRRSQTPHSSEKAYTTRQMMYGCFSFARTSKLDPWDQRFIRRQNVVLKIRERKQSCDPQRPESNRKTNKLALCKRSIPRRANHLKLIIFSLDHQRSRKKGFRDRCKSTLKELVRTLLHWINNIQNF